MEEPKPSVQYIIDLDDFEGNMGVWNFKTFKYGPKALKFAESLAINNPDLGVTIRVEVDFRKKNILRTSQP